MMSWENQKVESLEKENAELKDKLLEVCEDLNQIKLAWISFKYATSTGTDLNRAMGHLNKAFEISSSKARKQTPVAAL
jgi:hypothetical protein